MSEQIVPGSRAAEVPEFLDRLLAVESTDTQKRFMQALGAFEREAREAHGKPWKALTEAQATALLTKISSAAGQRRDAASLRWHQGRRRRDLLLERGRHERTWLERQRGVRAARGLRVIDSFNSRWVFLAFLLAAPALSPAANSETAPGANSDRYGNYRAADDRLLGIDRFITDDGQQAMLFADYSSGVVRRLFPREGMEFVIGPGFNDASPTELSVRFMEDGRGNTTGVSLRYANGTQVLAERVPLVEEEISFEQADAELAGTLLLPATRGPHPRSSCYTVQAR